MNVLSGEIEPDVAVAVAGHRIAGVGREYAEGRQIVELDGHAILPGFIDAHVHIESSLVTPREFARGGEVLARLPLPVGGLMSTEPVKEVRRRLDAVTGAARSLGSDLHDPFMAMSFLGLEVIPTLKITDRGLVEVGRFELVDLWV